MKISWFRKTVLFLHWLLSLLLAALTVGLCVCPDLVERVEYRMNTMFGGRCVGIISYMLLGIYVLLAFLTVTFIFSGSKNRRDRGFITVDSSESGRTRIAVGAVDQMIRQAVRNVEGVVDMKSSIINCEDAISINANVTIASDAHVPTVTMNLQRAVRSYIELNCGVAVREICVNVNALDGGETGGRHGRRRGLEGSSQFSKADIIADVSAAEEARPTVSQTAECVTHSENDIEPEENTESEEVSE